MRVWGGQETLGNQRKGNRGEDVALRYLLSRGLQLVERNYRTRYGEVDLVLRQSGTLVFVEVKWRSSLDYGSPMEAVDDRKQQAIRSMAEQYLAEKEPDFEEIRFDVVGILAGAGNARIEYVKDAF